MKRRPFSLVQQPIQRARTGAFLLLTALMLLAVMRLDITAPGHLGSENHLQGANVLDSDKATEDADVKFFRDEVEPIFKESCQRCHGEKKQESNLRLDSRDALLKGGENGPAIVPGKPDESLILKVLEYTGDIQMPPDAKLDDDKQQAIKKWIEKNAPWPKAKT